MTSKCRANTMPWVPFPDPGFFAYYCGVHGGADDGSTMAGVIWVR